jgi:ABC-2 type transport system permease protein
MRHAVHAEWTKLRTVPSTGWLLLAVVAFTIAVSAIAASSASTTFCEVPAECPADLPQLSLTGLWLGQALVAVLASLTITNEYGTRLITTTLAANPRRVRVLLVKAGVVTALALAAGLAAVAGSLLAGSGILTSSGFTAGSGYPHLALTEASTVRAAAGTVLYFGLVAVLSVGIGAIVRDTAGAVTTALGVLYVFPLLASFVSDPDWQEWLERISPTSGMNIQQTVGLDEMVVGPWAGLGILAGWAGAAMLLGTLLFRFRDA